MKELLSYTMIALLETIAVSIALARDFPCVDFTVRRSILQTAERGSHWLRVRREIVGDPLNLMRVMPP